MKDFIKTVLLVAGFYGLIVFSFLWFNKGGKDLKSVPYVQEFFLVVGVFSDFVNKNSVDNFKIDHIFNKEKEEVENLLPSSSEGWDDYLSE